jgi:hypothetical protein
MKKGTSGVSFTTLLQTVFIVLKLTGLISWSWVWVLAPFWVSVGLLVLYLAVVGVMAAHKETLRRPGKL